MPVVIIATIKPLPAHREEARAALLTAIEQVHGEDGCELYALHQAEDRFVIVEKWASPAAVRTHSGSPALQKLHADLDGKLEEPFDVVRLEPVPGGDAAKGAL